MFCPKKFFDFIFKPVLLDRSHQYKSHGAFSFFLCPIFAENKAGYTAADASGSAISLFPAARLCACVCMCVCARMRVRVCFANSKKTGYGRTDRQTNRPTDERIDGRTDPLIEIKGRI